MSLLDFVEEDKYVPSPIEVERRNRIMIALYAYAYEFESDPLVDDGTFDALALKINKEVDTGHPVMDKFFKEEFEPDTGQWIHKHPELNKLKALHFQHKHKFKHLRVGELVIDLKKKKVVFVG